MGVQRSLAFVLAVVIVVSTLPVGAASPTPTDGERAIIVITETADRERALSQIEASGTIHEQTETNTEIYVTATVRDRSSIERLDGVEVARTGSVKVPRGVGVSSNESVNETQRVPWGVERIGADDALKSQGDVDVAVLDTGIDYDHDELDHAVVWGVRTTGTGDPVEGLEAADDNGGHGTHVAGTIAAADDDDGVVGVAPNVDLYSVKTLSASGRGTYTDLIQGINVALAGPDGEVGTEDDADVITMSLGGDNPSDALRRAVENARENGAVVVASVGNRGDGDPTTNEVQYPAKYDAVIGVGGTTQDDGPLYIGSEGEEVLISAPGLGVTSTRNSGGVTKKTGTSMAAPHVAGTAALVLSNTQSAPPERVRQRLTATAEDILPTGVDRQTGVGIVRADAATGATDATYPPFATITSPDDGQEVSGNMTVRVAATDTEDNITSLDVTVQVGDRRRPASLNGETYTTTFSTTQLPEDQRVPVRVTVTDSDNNTYSKEIAVTVNNEEDPQPRLRVEGIEVQQDVTVGETATVEILASNDGGRHGILRGAVRKGDETQPRTFEARIPADERKRVTVPLTYEEAGTYTVRVLFEDTDGQFFERNITVRNANLFEEPLPNVPSANPPADTDNDGIHEDVNGDGQVTFEDSMGLLVCSCDNLTREQRDALDVVPNGRITRSDSVAHAEQFVERDEGVPSDPDSDGLYEDVNGDGDFTISDVAELYRDIDDREWMQQYARVFDFNNDGAADKSDVNTLLDELQEAEQ